MLGRRHLVEHFVSVIFHHSLINFCAVLGYDIFDNFALFIEFCFDISGFDLRFWSIFRSVQVIVSSGVDDLVRFDGLRLSLLA